MTNRQWIARILIAVFVIAVLVGGGLTLYKFGYKHGLANDGEGKFGYYGGKMGFMHDMDGFEHHMDEDSWMPYQGGGMHNGKGGWYGAPKQGFDKGYYDMGYYKSGWHFSSPLGWIIRLVVLGFFLWVVYVVVSRLFISSGWQLSFKTVESSDSKEKEKKSKK